MADQSYDRRHAWYQERDPVWRYNRAHFAGSRILSAQDNPLATTTQRYLQPFGVEAERSYTARLDRALGLYDNLPARAVQAYTSHLYQQETLRELSPGGERMVENVDLLGTAAATFFEAVADEREVVGIHFILVDAPSDVGGLSEAEAESRGVRPWIESIRAECVIDWDVERLDPARRGKLNYVVIEDEVTRASGPFLAPVRLKRWRIYWPDRFRTILRPLGSKDAVTSAAGDEVIEGRHGFGEVPLVPVYDRRLGPMRGATIMDDLARLANKLWNIRSVVDESTYWHGFPQMYFTLVDNRQVGDVNLGEARAIGLQAGEAVGFAEPSGSAFEMGKSTVAELLERAADLIFARTARQLPTAQVESAEKRNIDRAEFTALLRRKARAMEEAETAVWRLVARALGEDESVVHVTYPTEFRVDERGLDEWMKGIEAGILSRLDAVRAFNPGLTQEEAEAFLADNLAREKALRPAAQATARFGAELERAFGARAQSPGADPPPTGEAAAGTERPAPAASGPGEAAAA